jgi:hypothetical protein
MGGSTPPTGRMNINERANRDSGGRFGKGNSVHAIVKGTSRYRSKRDVKKLCTNSIEKVVRMLFQMTDPELNTWLEDNRGTLSAAELAFLAQRKDIRTFESLLDRVLGKTINIETNSHGKNAVIERLYQLSDEGMQDEMDDLEDIQNIIDAESITIDREI